MADKVSCASRLRSALDMKDMTQADLCRLTGIPKSAISQYCNGALVPRQERTRLIASVLGVSEPWLMGFDVPISGGSTSGISSQVFIKNLSAVINNGNKSDLIAAGIDLCEVHRIVSGDIPLTFDCACQLANQLGETLDSMMEIEKPTINDGELDELTKIFTALSPDNRAKLLELSRLYLSAQHNTEESK